MVPYLNPIDSPHHMFAHGLRDGIHDKQRGTLRTMVPGVPTGPTEVGTAQGIYFIGYLLGQRLAKNVPGHAAAIDPALHFKGYLSRVSPRKREEIYNRVLLCALGSRVEAHAHIEPTEAEWAAARVEADAICGLPSATEAAYAVG